MQGDAVALLKGQYLMTRDDDDKGGKRPHSRSGKDTETGRFDRKDRPPRDRNDRDKNDRDKGERKPGPRKSTPFNVEDDGAERIAKRLARAGIASRREAETMIAAGRISVNGKVLESPAINVKRTDIVTVDGKPLRQAERTRLWLYHKPAGLVTTNRDPEGRPTVFEALPPEMPRVLSVGRLDINTEGLLLLTNDGGLSRVLELPSTGWLRRYRVRAHGKVTQAQLDELKNGIAVDGVFYGSIEAELERVQGANVWISIGLREGKNREVKNILGALGLTVGRLIRVSFGPFQLADLEEGAVREINGRTLRDQLGDNLIADSGADFDAPVHNEFSNSAVQGRTRREMEQGQGEGEGEGERRRPVREREWISSQPERRKPREEKTEKVEPRRRGNANVWMAPGARPQGEKAAAKSAAKTARVEHQLPHRAAKFSGDLKVRPRRADDERPVRHDPRREEKEERRSPRGEARPRSEPRSQPHGQPRGEGRFDKDRPRPYSPRPGAGEKRDDGRNERRPGKRERAELRDGAPAGERAQDRPKGGFEGRSRSDRPGNPGGPRGEGRFGGSDRDTRSTSRSEGTRGRPGSGGFGGKPAGKPGGKPGGRPDGGGGKGPSGGKPKGRPGGSGADRRR